jgi:uncharacterized membrane protein YcaP (DUF421 family)
MVILRITGKRQAGQLARFDLVQAIIHNGHVYRDANRYDAILARSHD